MDRCEICGWNFAFGRAHRCVARESAKASPVEMVTPVVTVVTPVVTSTPKVVTPMVTRKRHRAAYMRNYRFRCKDAIEVNGLLGLGS